MSKRNIFRSEYYSLNAKVKSENGLNVMLWTLVEKIIRSMQEKQMCPVHTGTARSRPGIHQQPGAGS